jgi:hypothetical protein
LRGGVLILGLWSVLGACTPARPKSPDSSDPESEGLLVASPAPTVDMAKLRAREAAGLTPVAAAGTGWKARILASGPAVIESKQGTVAVRAPIGTESAVSCFLYSVPIDPGAALAKIIDGTTSAELTVVEVTPPIVDLVGDAGMIRLSAFYSARTPQGPAIGQLKLAVHARAESPALCIHDEVGYEQTFAQVASSLFESYVREKAATPSYVEVSFSSVGGQALGVDRSVLRRDAKGRREESTCGTSLAVISPVRLVVEDRCSTRKVTADGYLEHGHWVVAERTQITRDITLERMPSGRYRLQGTHQGQPVSADLKPKSPAGIAGDDVVAAKLRSAPKQKAFELTLDQYIPGLVPTALVEVHYSRAPGSDLVVQLVRGERATSKVDARGYPREAELPLDGGKTLLYRRVFEQGKR